MHAEWWILFGLKKLSLDDTRVVEGDWVNTQVLLGPPCQFEGILSIYLSLNAIKVS